MFLMLQEYELWLSWSENCSFDYSKQWVQRIINNSTIIGKLRYRFYWLFINQNRWLNSRKQFMQNIQKNYCTFLFQPILTVLSYDCTAFCKSLILSILCTKYKAGAMHIFHLWSFYLLDSKVIIKLHQIILH